MLLVLHHRWLCGCHSCVLAFTAMWATLAGAQRARRVGEVLDAICLFLSAEGFVSGGGCNLVILDLKMRTVKLNTRLLLLVLFLLMGREKARKNCLVSMTIIYRVYKCCSQKVVRLSKGNIVCSSKVHYSYQSCVTDI